jgi:hypothetical protein
VKTGNPSAYATVNWKVCKSASAVLPALIVIKKDLLLSDF